MVVTHAARGPSAFGRGPRARFVVVTGLCVLMVGCVERAVELEPPRDARHSHDALLWEKRWPVLEFHVYYQEGVAPEESALDVLVETARQVTHRTEVRLVGRTVIEGHPNARDHVWNKVEMAKVIREYAGPAPHRFYTDEGHARVPILYVNGRNEGRGILGFESEGTLVLFPSRWRGDPATNRPLSEDAPGSWSAERSVVVHEFGHAMGLVSCGIPMVRHHASSQDECHSSNDRSVMTASADGFTPMLDEAVDMGWLPYKFDADDLADLEAFRNSPKNVAGGAPP